MRATGGDENVTIREGHEDTSPPVGGGHDQLPVARRAEYRPPTIARLGDLRSAVLGGSPGAGDSVPPNTKPI